jgi:hypothetical protein
MEGPTMTRVRFTEEQIVAIIQERLAATSYEDVEVMEREGLFITQAFVAKTPGAFSTRGFVGI